MKILKRGEAPEVTPWWIGKIVTCKNCKSEIELQALDDLNKVTVNDNNVEFTCPLFGCGNLIKIKNSANKSSMGQKN